MNKEAVCCFCGKSVLVKEAISLSVKVNIDAVEEQGFLCHRKCLKSKLDKRIANYLFIDL
ncbi:MAG: hypothetical protein CMO82_02150 [Winogradskyella sp.]|nr:hypothetical protein [Winogradskyella sp.]